MKAERLFCGIALAERVERAEAQLIAAGSEAVVTAQPGSTSQQNAQRRGFDLLYTRAILVKQP
jgi:hypothetical protein